MNKIKYIFALFIVFLIASCNTVQTTDGVYEVVDVMKSKDKNKPHDFSWKQNENDVYFSEAFKGKVVFLNIWGTWCPPCRREIPEIIKLQEELKDQGLAVVGIATERGSDLSENRQKVFNYVEQSGINYPNFVMSREHIGSTYAPNAVPTTYIINRKGDIVDKVVGGMDYKAFKELVLKHL